MTKVQALVPLTGPNGDPIAPGQLVDVDEETVKAWRADGKAALVSDLEREPEPGNYSARTHREDTASTKEKKK